jgi:hypothetical protein
MLPTKFRFISTSGFRGGGFSISAYQKQELPVEAMFVNGSGRTPQAILVSDWLISKISSLLKER